MSISTDSAWTRAIRIWFGNSLDESLSQISRTMIGGAGYWCSRQGAITQWRCLIKPFALSAIVLICISRRVFKGLDVSLGAYNLLNTRYADPGAEEHRQSSIQQDGRNWRLKLTYQFGGDR